MGSDPPSCPQHSQSTYASQKEAPGQHGSIANAETWGQGQQPGAEPQEAGIRELQLGTEPFHLPEEGKTQRLRLALRGWHQPSGQRGRARVLQGKIR